MAITHVLAGARPLDQIGVAAGALAAGTALVGIGVASLKMAGDFQAGITSLVTGAGESRANLKLVSDGILNLATQTGTSAQQLTDGMYMIESAGYHGAAGLDVLKAAAMGAKVGNADLGTVADATTTIMKDYPNVMHGASGAVNTLIATVASGKTHMADLSQSLAMILPTASAAHVGLNDVMGAMATMTGEGVPAANAATYLRQTILALDAPGKQAQNALASIGLSSKDVATALQTSLPGALQMITEHLGKKFPEGSAAYVQALKDISGGSKTMQGMLDLTSTHLGEFKTNVAGVGDAVKKGGGAVQGWADVQQTFNFKMSQAHEVVETLGIKLGTKLLPAATQVIGFVSDKAVPAISNFVTWITSTSSSAETVRPILIGLGVAIAGALVAAFVSWAVAAGAAAVATLAATWPILAIGAGIAGLIAVVVLAVTHWGQITEALGRFKDMVWNAVKPAITALGDAFSGLGAIASGVWNGIKSGINGVIDAIDAFIHGVDNIHVSLPGGATLGFSIPTIPKLAEGGTAQQSGMALVGERGPELLSLPRGASVLPLPSGLPAGLSGVGAGSGGVIEIHNYLTLDGRIAAQSVVRHMPGVIRNATGVRGI